MCPIFKIKFFTAIAHSFFTSLLALTKCYLRRFPSWLIECLLFTLLLFRQTLPPPCSLGRVLGLRLDSRPILLRRLFRLFTALDPLCLRLIVALLPFHCPCLAKLHRVVLSYYGLRVVPLGSGWFLVKLPLHSPYYPARPWCNTVLPVPLDSLSNERVLLQPLVVSRILPWIFRILPTVPTESFLGSHFPPPVEFPFGSHGSPVQFLL